MKTYITLLMTVSLYAPSITLAADNLDSQNDAIEKQVTAQSPTGESMEITQVMSQNTDGSFTIVALKPAEKVKAFYDRACKEEFGEEAHYSGLARISHEGIKRSG